MRLHDGSISRHFAKHDTADQSGQGGPVSSARHRAFELQDQVAPPPACGCCCGHRSTYTLSASPWARPVRPAAPFQSSQTAIAAAQAIPWLRKDFQRGRRSVDAADHRRSCGRGRDAECRRHRSDGWQHQHSGAYMGDVAENCRPIRAEMRCRSICSFPAREMTPVERRPSSSRRNLRRAAITSPARP